MGDHPSARRFRLGVHPDVVHEIEAVLLDVGQNARQALVLDFALVLAGTVLLNGDRHRDAQQDHEEFDRSTLRIRLLSVFAMAPLIQQDPQPNGFGGGAQLLRAHARVLYSLGAVLTTRVQTGLWTVFWPSGLRIFISIQRFHALFEIQSVDCDGRARPARVGAGADRGGQGQPCRLVCGPMASRPREEDLRPCDGPVMPGYFYRTGKIRQRAAHSYSTWPEVGR